MTEEEEARLIDAVRRVQRDLDATLGPGAIQIDPNTTEGSDLWIRVGAQATTGFWPHPGEPREWVVARLADTVQDAIAESSRFWGTAWPPCPHPAHTHPLTPSHEVGGSWRCRASEELIAEIGWLGSTEPPSP